MFAPEKDLERKDTLFGRKNTLVKYDRHVELDRSLSSRKPKQRKSAWTVFSLTITACILSPCMRMCGITGRQPQQAWREKVAICVIVTFVSAFTLFFLLFYNDLSCPARDITGSVPVNVFGGVIVRGVMYNATGAVEPFNTLSQSTTTPDVTAMFSGLSSDSCNDVSEPFASFKTACQRNSSCLSLKELTRPKSNIYGLMPFILSGGLQISPRVRFDWTSIAQRNLQALKNGIIDINFYIKNAPIDSTSKSDTILRQANTMLDATLLLTAHSDVFTPQLTQCLIDKYSAGDLLLSSVQCVIAQALKNITLFIVLAVVLTRFILAVVFSWVLSEKLAKTPVAVYEHGSPTSTLVSKPTELDTVFLVTCYSEGRESLKTTLDSLVATAYPDDKKLLFIVADGMIVGKGNGKSTPDLILDMMTFDASSLLPIPSSYLAVASGTKMHNMAKVYAGHYFASDHCVACVLIVKCGTPEEIITAQKPGNRGKRDSQLILMNFFSRITTNDYLTPLDYDLYTKITHITGKNPGVYEIVLMVDADTRVDHKALRYMVNAMVNDPLVIGLCGETQIANKTDTWVTWIQVFEYYISHHLGKAFESVFGVVTCLPGCFSMFRIKARKGDKWIQLLVHPDILAVYSTTTVESLHDKLGEDRFLSTLILSTFVKRKMVFVPQALSDTQVPDDFRTLLSQRRRWINSTIHNLIELFLVRNLCGTFCLSMQFIVAMDLIGTAVLPVGMFLTYYLLISAIVSPHPDLASYIPTIILLFVIFMPAVLLVLTHPSITRLGWMIVYVVSLPIWNLLFPLYSFWHMDSFSWGATRILEGGEDKELDDNGEFDRSAIPMRRLKDFEGVQV